MFYAVRSLAVSVVRLLEMLILFRALLSWFPQMRDSAVADFLYRVTEPVILPFRKLLNRFEALRSIPLDFSVLAAFLALELILGLLTSL